MKTKECIKSYIYHMSAKLGLFFLGQKDEKSAGYITISARKYADYIL